MKSNFLADLPSCPETFSAAHLVTLNLSPMWMRVPCAVKLSSLPRYEIDELIKEKRIKVAWRRNKIGKLHPLIYGPSLWALMDRWAEEEPAEGKEAVKREIHPLKVRRPSGKLGQRGILMRLRTHQ
jgi:hypothetical protein